MNDPLFGPLEIGDGAPLFGRAPATFAPNAPGDGVAGDALGLDATTVCGVLPWHAGAFALLLHDLPTGTPTVAVAGESLAVLLQTRLLRPDSQQTLLVVEGQPPAREGIVLSLTSADRVRRIPLRPAPAPLDRSLVSLIAQALARSDTPPIERRNWQPLTRHLATLSELAVRAELSLPVGRGLALVLDGDIGVFEEEPLVIALDGPSLTAHKARVAPDPQSGRSIIVLPALAARCFLLLEDGLVDVTCPPGATRSAVARSPGAMALRPSEGEVLLDLLAALSLDVGSRVPDWLPVPHALGWRGSDGGSLAVVGAVPVEAGTVLFLAADNRDHELGNLTLRDLAHEGEALLEVARPIATFHPDPARHPGRLHIVLLLPRRLPAGALHVGLGMSDGGGWLRTMDAAAPQTRTILRAWLPPAPAQEAYLRIVAASVRAAAARAPTVVAVDTLSDDVRAAAAVALVIALEGGADAAETTQRSLAETLRPGIPIVFVLGVSDPGYEVIMERLAASGHDDHLEIGFVALAGPAGAASAITVAFARLQAARALVVEAGTRFTGRAAALDVLDRPKAGARRRMMLAEGVEGPVAAVLPRRVVDRWTAAADLRLTGLSAVLGDLAGVMAGHGEPALSGKGFDFERDAGRPPSYEVLLDAALLAAPRPQAAHRGTA